MDRLKNCPFCGGDDIRVEKLENGSSRVCCYDCMGFWQCCDADQIEADQIEAWNRRANSDQIQKIVEENQAMFAENMRLQKDLDKERAYNSAFITLIKAGAFK